MAETLAGAAGVFARLAESEAGEIPDRAEGMAGEMEELARALDSGEGVAASEPALEPEPEPEPEPTPDPEAQPAPAPESGREEEPFRLDADPSMLSLFLEEAATSAQVLNNGLVELEESGASGEGIEPLMRAAHSIKGAARIVNIPPAVELAHAMEDVLVEAQEGRTALDQKAVDHLLSGVDLFLDISRSTPEDLGGALGKLVPRMANVRDRLQGREPEAPAAPAKPVQPEPKTAPKPLPEEEPAQEKAPKPKPGQPARSEPDQAKPVSRSSDASLRVSARNLDRIMALAGEYIIEAARTRELGQGLKEVKGALGEGFRLLAELREEAWRCRQAVEAAESEEPGAVRVQGHLPGRADSRVWPSGSTGRPRPLPPTWTGSRPTPAAPKTFPKGSTTRWWKAACAPSATARPGSPAWCATWPGTWARRPGSRSGARRPGWTGTSWSGWRLP